MLTSFKNVKTRYIGVDGDTVYSGIFGYFIGNNKNATPNRANLPFLTVHTIANQNINNLKFVDVEDPEEVKKLLERIYPNDGIRKFNFLGGEQ
ncbi:Uncharacterised protein [Canicola haemoglobinophilus]|uniref:Uncharacterized protein n=1 Tax=Canicola haemoglobinophilus TaxID=733 RepID=A0AB38HAL8_9PAST|nr:hypothetical protein [Canicola haemoglobinophilus]STO55033.1 Uncharacterised protein [Canicola haemoglobinophilus]STO69396.1 Uncharacterised protein [Canicola haemoglobinophilus]